MEKLLPSLTSGLSVDMTLPKWVIFSMGVYGNILSLLSNIAEISFPTT